MPLFGKNPGDTGATWEPQAADSRLAQTAGAEPGGVFTSDLSVSEYVLLGEAGFEPLGFVVGSSIYHVGLQMGRWSQNQELQVLSQAMYNARELAMSRMRAESDHLGADGIVGVELRLQMYAWGQDVLEFVATGTAVKATGGTGAHRAPDAPQPGWAGQYSIVDDRLLAAAVHRVRRHRAAERVRGRAAAHAGAPALRAAGRTARHQPVRGPGGCPPAAMRQPARRRPLVLDRLVLDRPTSPLRTGPAAEQALLEAMGEGQVSVDGQTRRVPQPFVVLATDNPIEYEGTHELPEAQLDRFLMRLRLGHLAAADETAMLQRRWTGRSRSPRSRTASPCARNCGSARSARTMSSPG